MLVIQLQVAIAELEAQVLRYVTKRNLQVLWPSYNSWIISRQTYNISVIIGAKYMVFVLYLASHFIYLASHFLHLLIIPAFADLAEISEPLLDSFE